ncbi:phytoene/squalene synthase family protein [Hwanghaeella sp.]|uniref:phytoene/squalene synthase family protein n=1 Tax=Hwanghaeella sp. TaxID=2605943 RepID=UPI003CCBC993
MKAGKDTGKALSYCAELVYGQDRERFLSAMTAPADRREFLFALYAFNHEIAKTSGVVSEPMLGQIRLQWWREAIDECYGGSPRRHAVVTALARAIAETTPSRSIFERVIDAREGDLEFASPKTMADLEGYAAATSGGLTELALEISSGLGEGLPDMARQAARDIGTAWGMIGLMRALPFHMRARRGMMPTDVAYSHNVSSVDLAEARNVPGLSLAVEEVCGRASGLLNRARVNRQLNVSIADVFGALSIGVLADSHLRQLKKVRYDVFDPRLSAPPALRGLSLMLRSLRNRY